MEFDFSVQKVMHQFSAGTTQEDVCIMRGTHMRQNRCDSRQSKEISQLTAVIDKMGEASAKVGFSTHHSNLLGSSTTSSNHNSLKNVLPRTYRLFQSRRQEMHWLH